MKKKFNSFIYIFICLLFIGCQKEVPQSYSITIDSEIINGSITSDKTSASKGDMVTLSFFPDEGYTFSYVNITAPGYLLHLTETTENTLSFTMPDQSVVIHAVFSKIPYKISIDSTIENGSIKSSKSWSTLGEQIILTATPAEEYELKTITVLDSLNNNLTLEGSGNTRSFIMPNSDVNVSGTFEKLPDTKAPGNIINITKEEEHDSSVTFIWTNPKDEDLYEILIKYKRQSSTEYNEIKLSDDELKAQKYTLTGLTNNYYYDVYIYCIDFAGNVSSGVFIQVITNDTTPPSPVTNVTAEASHRTVRLTWNNPKEEDLYQFRVEYINPQNNLNSKLFTVTSEERESGISINYINNLQNNVEYEFKIYSIDYYNNESKPYIIKATPISVYRIRNEQDLKYFLDYDYKDVEEGIIENDIAFTEQVVWREYNHTLNLNSHTLTFENVVPFDMQNYANDEHQYDLCITDKSETRGGKIYHAKNGSIFRLNGNNLRLSNISIIGKDIYSIIDNGNTHNKGGSIIIENCDIRLERKDTCVESSADFSPSVIRHYGKGIKISNSNISVCNATYIICATNINDSVTELSGGKYNLEITQLSSYNSTSEKLNIGAFNVTDLLVDGKTEVNVSIKNIENPGHLFCIKGYKVTINDGIFLVDNNSLTIQPVSIYATKELHLNNGKLTAKGTNAVNLLYDKYASIYNASNTKWERGKITSTNMSDFESFIQPVVLENHSVEEE